VYSFRKTSLLAEGSRKAKANVKAEVKSKTAGSMLVASLRRYRRLRQK
jgi:hypothetical protein